MDKQQAWNLVAQAVPLVKLTLQEHQMLNQALQVLKPIEEVKEEPKEE